MGCATNCTGYELAGDLDFDTNGNGVLDVRDAYWNDGAGWEPIGTYTATFEGNGRTIANLVIDRSETNEVGLFGRLGAGGVVRHVGLRAVEVTGRDETGGLVGDNDRGTIRASYVTGRVTGRARVGGLVGNIYQGAVSVSYAATAVTGSDWDIGGLVGRNDRGTISAGYATGAVTNLHRVAGLVGNNSGGTIEASYATGAVRGERDPGGLLGGRSSGTITASYWDTATSGQSTSGGGVGQTTSGLQTPVGYTGIYAAWNVDVDGVTGTDDPWHFGTGSQYPALKVDFNGDGTASWEEFGDQRPAADAGRVDYDADDDGLIEVANLAQLHAIRWDLDGDGFAKEPGHAAAFPRAPPGMGCRTGCTGYELTGDLDFDTNGNGVVDVRDAYWNGGAGWEPIGTYATTFEGNGHTIANLVIDRDATNEVGLFSRLGSGGVVRNVGLEAVDITGRDETGGLVGDNDRGTIRASYVTGRVTGRARVGGLVGTNHRGAISASYAASAVTGSDWEIGGLAGRNDRGAISASYATGAVTNRHRVAGLVGYNSGGTITASYATGGVRGERYPGGLLGGGSSGTITASYWDTATSGQSTSGGGVGQTTSGLQTPVGYTGIYAAWNVDVDGVTGTDDPWHFGTGSQYPALKVDFNGDGTASWEEFGDQRPLPGAPGNLSATAGNGRAVLGWEPPPAFTIDQYPIVKYQYQQDSGTWTDIANSVAGGANATSFAVSGLTNGTSYSFSVRAINANGTGAMSATVAVTPAAGDYDTDDDGLIEVATLAQLHAIRWDLDGDGASTDPRYAAAFLDASTGMGCPATGCAGYELVGDLDFDTNGNGVADAGDAYWNGGAGWEPIGPYTATFEGNGHTLSNLFIDRDATDEVGFFSRLGTGGVIRRVGLRGMDVRGRNEVGGLVGDSDGSVTASYASGAVTGNHVVGGLAGRNDGTITTSYASGTVAGDDYVGGLVGTNGRGDMITASYAGSEVTGAGPGGHAHHGGLAGRNDGRISASYAWGRVTETHGSAGGLVGSKHGDARVTASYWDTATSGQTRSAGGVGKTTAEVQTPTGYADIYADWNVDVDGVTGNDDPWHFGTASQYPVLKVDFNGDGTASWEEFGDQRPAPDVSRVDYDADNDGLIEVANLAQLHAIRWDLDGDGFAADAGYAAAFPNAPSGMGCLTGCMGYELTGDLDFDTNGNGVADAGDAYWNGGAGWEPIGPYTATFEGNGHTLSNLFIDRDATDEVGFFSRLGTGGVIRRVGLRGMDVRGRNEVGGLVGDSDGSVTASYASGTVAGDDRVGGLVGLSDGQITASYAGSAVTGVGPGGHADHGGLVGRAEKRGRISASYAWGRVTETHGSAGGLVGSKHGDARMTASYWDAATSGRTRSAGGVGKTTAELQTPTGYSGIYVDWNVDLDGETGGDDPWHFGTNAQYPMLKMDFNGDGTASWEEFGDQRPAPDASRVDYDADNDGLIEVANLAQLNAIRWDLDGDGFAAEAGYAAAFPNAPSGMGCLTGCMGYELTADLDFDTNGNGVADAGDAYWNGGAGWEPIGLYTATFEGNGQTLSNLFIDREETDEVGFFSRLGTSSVVRRVGLRAVDVTGWNETGGLVADNDGGTIRASYVTGSVAGRWRVGGLVGHNGGGRISASYAASAVTGSNWEIGGLVGWNSGGTITASYATGAVTNQHRVAGLVGYNSRGTITASYATGAVRGAGNLGGLVGGSDGTVTASYWDTATSGQTRSSGGTGQTTAELQTPTGYADIYADWNVDVDGVTGNDDPWHFGTAAQYPVLQVDFNGDGTASWEEFGDQRPAPDATLVDYDADNDGLIEVANLAQLHAIRWDLDGNGFATEAGYAAAFPNAPSGMGCRTGCTGYELTADLDIDTNGNGVADAGDAYWNDGAGWSPIGTASRPLTATFEGNGHVIANLFIARGETDDVGLFGRIGTGGVIRNVGLRGADVTGRNDTGGLVGENNPGTIQASYVSGTVTGNDHIGGLVGRNHGHIRASYASGAVEGDDQVGGLAGYSGVNTTITASYASSSVTGVASASYQNHGGLVGRNDGRITASYAWGRVTEMHGSAGGLVGSKHSDARVTASYWDTATSGQSASRGGTGKTTSELQTPTGYNGIYADWNVDVDGVTGSDDPWHFGTTSQYPVLKVDVDGDGTVTWRELGQQYPNVPPAFAEGETATRSVDENTATGQDIGAPVTATDADEGDVVTYALGGTDAASFDLDTATGQLQTSAALDYEAQAEYEVIITASDNHGDSSSITVTITVGDLVDSPPAPANLAPGTVTASTVPLSWDAVTGAAKYRVEYRVTDAETWTTDDETLTTATHTVDELYCGTAYEFQVSTYGDGTTHTAEWSAPTGTVAAGTSACPAPVFGEETYAFSVAEDVATDADVGTITATITGGPAVTYAITAGNTAGAFAIDSASGELTVAKALDYETTASYALTVTASYGASTATVAVAITITNVVEPPVFGATSYAFTVAEDAAISSTIGTVAATDPEGGTVIYFDITAGDDDNLFAVDALAGRLVVAVPLDYESTASHTLTVRASTPKGATTTVTVTVTVTDVAEPPVFGATSYAFSVAGDAAVEAVVGTVTATVRANGAVSYAITAGDENGAFAIDDETGELTVASALDYGTTASYALTVTASHGVSTTTVPVAVTITAPTPVFAKASYAFGVAEDAAVGTAVGTVAATVVGSSAIAHTITAGNTGDAFAIAGAGGQLSVAAALDAETAATYTLTVQASVGTGDDVKTATTTVTLTVQGAPPAPANLTVGTLTQTSVPLSWDAVPGAAKYRVEYRATGTETEEGETVSWITDDETLTGTTHTVDELTCGTAYEFQVTAFGDQVVHTAAWGAPATAVTATTAICPPPAPDNLAAGTVGKTSIPLTWDAVSGAAKYRVEYRVGGTDTWTTASDATTGATYTVDDLSCGTSYEVQVSAFGDGVSLVAEWGAASTVVTAATALCAPPAPTNVAAGTVGKTSIPFTWDAVTGATKYRVEYRVSGADTWTTASDSITAAAYTVEELTCGTSYAVQVSAFGDGASLAAEWGAASTALTAATALCAPPAPTNVAAGTVGKTSIPFTWDAVTGATKYRVEYRVSDADTWTTASDAITAAAYTVEELTCGTAYEFRVSIYGDGSTLAAAWGAATTALAASTGACDPCDPLTVVDATLTKVTGTTKVRFNWGYGNGCTEFEAARYHIGYAVEYADGTKTTGEYQSITAPPLNFSPRMTHETSGSPLVRFRWTDLDFVLEEGDDPSENLTFSFDPAPKLEYNWPPAFGKASYAFTLAEDAAVAAAVGSVSASDPNAGDTVTFSITAGNTGDAFAINASSGAIAVAAALDFETTSTYSLTVQASDSESAAATVAVTVTVTDVAEPPVFGETSYAFSVAEDAAEDAAVGTVSATARANGAVTYAITAGNDAGDFAIDASSGAIAVDGALDYETTSSYALTVTASHGVSTSTVAVAITVTDVAEPPVFGETSYAFSVAEDAAEDAAVGTVSATARANGAVSYAITAGNDSGAFAIDASSGAITVDGTLDYETTTSYALTVTASHGVSTSTIAVAITVTDVVDTRPAKPTNLTATVNPAGSITLSWDDPDDASITGYQILRRRPTEGEKELLVYVENTGSSATTYTDTSVTDGVRHVYRIKAINAIGLSEISHFVRADP
ncbi:MAG: cadherin domain-containing protein [Chloroflexi bacterium]|nr:cadherin domain-containing protein [Chloroflexota bacterium]